MRAALPMSAQNVLAQNDGRVAQAGAAKPREALSYTVPAAVPDAPAALPAARLTNYVFAHSKYSSVLGQSNVLSNLLSDADEQEAAAKAASRDARVAPAP
jgi:hypothetical protein